jgi:hypothetical protein
MASTELDGVFGHPRQRAGISRDKWTESILLGSEPHDALPAVVGSVTTLTSGGKKSR